MNDNNLIEILEKKFPGNKIRLSVLAPSGSKFINKWEAKPNQIFVNINDKIMDEFPLPKDLGFLSLEGKTYKDFLVEELTKFIDDKLRNNS